jgi:allophanate hydrolase subunit 2
MTILSPGVDMIVQDFPGRDTRLGIPRSGPLDSMSFRAANILVDNPADLEGLEMIVLPGTHATIHFHVPVVIAVTGKEVAVKVNGEETKMWASVTVPAGGQLSLSAQSENTDGLRTYLAIRGGFPLIPKYLGSKSTSMGLGGFQACSFHLPGISNADDMFDNPGSCAY